MIYIVFILLLCLFSFLGYVLGKRKNIVQQKKIDDSLYEELDKLNQQKAEINNQIVQAKANKEIAENNLNNEISQLETRKNLMSENITELEHQASTAAEMFYNERMEMAQARFESSLEKEEENYSKSLDEYKKQYDEVLEDLVNEYKKLSEENNSEVLKLNQNILELQQKLTSLKEKVEAAIESDKKAMLEQEEQNYYKCQISDLDIEEIHRLREIEPYFRNIRPISKVIWESYYKDPCDKLMTRLTSGKDISGIYKITNLSNGKCYVGQAVNLADRLRNHIKCGIGIDPPNNQMYKDMKATGVENFLFEIVQECAPAKLNELEKFWIDHYETQSWGYNITKGGSQSRQN